MPKMKQAIEKFIRKSFWLSQKNKRDIEKEARQRKITESALVRHIISNWFKK